MVPDRMIIYVLVLIVILEAVCIVVMLDTAYSTYASRRLDVPTPPTLISGMATISIGVAFEALIFASCVTTVGKYGTKILLSAKFNIFWILSTVSFTLSGILILIYLQQKKAVLLPFWLVEYPYVLSIIILLSGGYLSHKRKAPILGNICVIVALSQLFVLFAMTLWIPLLIPLVVGARDIAIIYVLRK